MDCVTLSHVIAKHRDQLETWYNRSHVKFWSFGGNLIMLLKKPWLQGASASWCNEVTVGANNFTERDPIDMLERGLTC